MLTKGCSNWRVRRLKSLKSFAFSMLFAWQIKVYRRHLDSITIDHPYLVHRRVIFSATRVFLAARSVPYACNLHVFKHTARVRSTNRAHCHWQSPPCDNYACQKRCKYFYFLANEIKLLAPRSWLWHLFDPNMTHLTLFLFLPPVRYGPPRLVEWHRMGAGKGEHNSSSRLRRRWRYLADCGSARRLKPSHFKAM